MYYKKLFLIRAHGSEVKKFKLPHGLLSIKSYLRKFDIDSVIFDRALNLSPDDLKQEILQYNPDVIGISAMTMQIEDTQYLIKFIRAYFKDKIIVVGGIHFTALPNVGLEMGADYVFKGEAEIAMYNFMLNGPPKDEKIIQGEIIKNLDDIPAFTIDDIRSYFEPHNYYKNIHLQIMTARGCPYNCNFCLSRDQRPKGMRYHSVDYIIDLLEEIVNEFDTRQFFFVDDIFVIKPSKVREFCEKIKSRFQGYIRLTSFTHAGHGSTELYRLMFESGFTRVSMGVEHGNDRLLELCGKKTNKAGIEKTCSEIHKAGLELNLLYILGNITETNETITETVDFAIYLHNKYSASSSFSFMQPFPGSPIYTVAEDYGKYLPKRRTYQNIDINYIPNGVSVKHIIKERERGQLMGNYFGSLKSFRAIKLRDKYLKLVRKLKAKIRKFIRLSKAVVYKIFKINKGKNQKSKINYEVNSMSIKFS